METVKKIVANQYFPAGAVLAAAVLFWLVGSLGGLSLLHNNQPPLATLTWLLFVYASAAVTLFAGLLAAVDLVRRWRRNRAAAAWAAASAAGLPAEVPAAPVPAPAAPGPAPAAPAASAPAASAAPAPAAPPASAPATGPASNVPGTKKAA